VLDKYGDPGDAKGDTSQVVEPFDNPRLMHKVIHACMESENISEDEELEIIDRLTAASQAPTNAHTE
jgi:hypothetical protein